MLFFGKTTNGKLTLNNIKEFNRFVVLLGEGTKIELRIRKWRKKRILGQNRLYWSWLQIIGEFTGYDIDELHNTFKAMFLTDKTKKLPLVRSTTALKTKGFGEYLNKIERKVGEMGITVPHPEDLFEEKLKGRSKNKIKL